MHERLVYTFDDPGDSSVVATLRWEKLAVPFGIEVDSKAVVVDSLREQLRGLGRFFWQPWSQAAAWCAVNGVNLEEATAWADRSIGMNENFTNLRVKAALLSQRGDAAGSAAAAERSLAVANEARGQHVRLSAHGPGEGGLGDRDLPEEHPRASRSRGTPTTVSVRRTRRRARRSWRWRATRRRWRWCQDPVQKKRIQGALTEFR